MRSVPLDPAQKASPVSLTATHATNLGLRAAELFETLQRQIAEVVYVPDAVLEPIAVALCSGGHVLIEGIPGTGKTLLSRTLARCLDCDFKRIQFTNDLMPSDIVGSSVWRAHEGRFEFVPGPLFANVVLADEVNRTSSRTLSCLLEAMEEGQVSIEGRPVRLAEPFLILATRNPIEFHGTYPIPEAALDRFFARVELGYPDPQSERELYRGAEPEARLAELAPVISKDDLATLREVVSAIAIGEPLAAYAYRVVQASREHPAVALGVSPRAALAWLKGAKARAFLRGRAYVLPDDLKALGSTLLGHRVFLKAGGDARALVEELLASVPVEL